MTTEVTEPAPDRPAAPSRNGHHRTSVLVLLAVIVLPMSIATILARDVGPLSVLDEPAQVDALRRVEDLGYPRLGDPILPATARDIGCRGIGQLRLGTCEEPPPPDAIGLNGSSYEARKPPGYFVVTAVVRQLTGIFTDDYVLSARLTGPLWLAAGLVALWALLARTAIGLAGRASVVALVAGSPVVLHRSATVTSVASLLVLGTALAFCACVLGAESSWRRVAGVSAVAALSALFEPGALLAVIAIGLVVVARDRHGRTSLRSAARLACVALLPVLVAAGTTVGWEAVRDARSTESLDEVFRGPAVTDDPSDSITVGEASEYTGWFLVVYSGSTQASIVNDRDYTFGLSRIGLIILLAGPAGALVLGGDRRTIYGVGAFVVAVVGAWASAFHHHWAFSSDGAAPAYYGIVLLPFFALSLAHELRGRRAGTAVVACVAAALLVADFVSVLEF